MVYQKNHKLLFNLLVFIVLFSLFANIFTSSDLIGKRGNDLISFSENSSTFFALFPMIDASIIYKNIVFHMTEAESNIERVSLKNGRFKGWADSINAIPGNNISDKSYAKPPESVYLHDNTQRIIEALNDKDGKK